MDQGAAEGVGGVDDPTKDYPSIQSVHSQEDMVADLLQQAAEAGGVVDGQTGIVLDQGEEFLATRGCLHLDSTAQTQQ